MSSYYYPPPPPPPPLSSAQPAPPPPGQASGNPYPGRGGRGARHGGRGGNAGAPHQRYPPAQFGSGNTTSQWNYQTQQFSAPLNSNEAYPGWSQPGSQQPSFQHYPPSSSPYISLPSSTPQPYAYAGVPIPPPPLPAPSWNAPANAAPPPPFRIGFNERPRSRAQQPRNHHGAPSHFPGQKRKREHSPNGFTGASASSNSGRGSLSQRARNQERKPKVTAPPPVPNYGFAGLPPKPPPPAPAQSDRGNLGKKRGKKRKTNQLGLTPKADMHEASDQENDEDEEESFAKSGAPAIISYRGRVHDISSNTGLQAWIAERKKRFPTQARIAEKRAAEEKARQQREVRKKQVATQRAEGRKPDKSDFVKKRDKQSQDPSRQQELKRKKMEDLLRQANKLKAELEGADSNDENAESKSAKTQALKAIERNMSSDGFDDLSDEHSDEDVPEVQTSKASRPVKQTQKPTAGRMNTNIPCKYYLRDGHCRRKDCRFLHHIPDNVARKSLYERLTEQEFRSVGLKALQVIKELGDVGYFDEVTAK